MAHPLDAADKFEPQGWVRVIRGYVDDRVLAEGEILKVAHIIYGAYPGPYSSDAGLILERRSDSSAPGCDYPYIWEFDRFEPVSDAEKRFVDLEAQIALLTAQRDELVKTVTTEV